MRTYIIFSVMSLVVMQSGMASDPRDETKFQEWKRVFDGATEYPSLADLQASSPGESIYKAYRRRSQNRLQKAALVWDHVIEYDSYDEVLGLATTSGIPITDDELIDRMRPLLDSRVLSRTYAIHTGFVEDEENQYLVMNQPEKWRDLCHYNIELRWGVGPEGNPVELIHYHREFAYIYEDDVAVAQCLAAEFYGFRYLDGSLPSPN